MPSKSDWQPNAHDRHLGRNRLGPSAERSDSAMSSGDASAGQTRGEASDWIASFRDIRFTWDEPGRIGEPSRSSDDEWLRSLRGELQTEIDADATRDTTSGLPEPREWWRTADEEPAFAPDNRTALPAGADHPTRAISGMATATAGAFQDMPTAANSGKRLAIISVAVILLGVVAVVGAALIGKIGGANFSSSVRTTDRSEGTGTTASGGVTTTSIAPTAPPSQRGALPPTPTPFTVHSPCAGRDCPVAVRERPSTAANSVRWLRTGEVVQVVCSTHGGSVKDADTGQQSDVWYQLAGTNGYSSAMYLEGPTVPDCA